MFANFQIASFAITIRAETNISLPAYPGATLRGGLGYALKDICCISSGVCPHCSAASFCIFRRFFDSPTPVDAPVLSKNSHTPHPFVLDPPPVGGRLSPGAQIRFGISLIGEAIPFFPVFCKAFERLGRKGLGKGRGRYQLVKVTQLDLSDCTADPGTRPLNWSDFIGWAQGLPQDLYVTLTFQTPLRLKRNGSWCRNLTLGDILQNLLFRVCALTSFYCGCEVPTNIRELLSRSHGVTRKQSNFSWTSWCRYSGRQQRFINMGGILGTVTFCGIMDPFLLSLLKLGERLHLGKGTSLGLGKYSLRIGQHDHNIGTSTRAASLPN